MNLLEDPEYQARLKAIEDAHEKRANGKLVEIDKKIDFEKSLEQFHKLKEKLPNGDDVDWDLVTQDAKELEVIKSPVLTIAQLLATTYPAQRWIIDRFLPEGGITLLVGEAGTLKSYISLYIAKTLLTGEKLFGEFTTHRQCKILLIDKENKLPRIQRRMKGLGVPTSSEMWLIKSPETFLLENKEWVKFVQDFIAEHQIDVVIMDSFIDFFTGNENSSTDTAQAFNMIRSLSQTVQYILIHHDSKPIPKMIRTAAQKTRGSSNIIAQVDTQFYFEKGKDQHSLIIEQGKSRDEEPLTKFTVSIVSDPEIGITDFTYSGIILDEVTQIAQSKEIIYQFIKDHPSCTKDDINAELELNNLSLRTGKNALLILMKEGLVDYTEKPGSGRKHFYFVIEENDDETSF